MGLRVYERQQPCSHHTPQSSWWGDFLVKPLPLLVAFELLALQEYPGRKEPPGILEHWASGRDMDQSDSIPGRPNTTTGWGSVHMRGWRSRTVLLAHLTLGLPRSGEDHFSRCSEAQSCYPRYQVWQKWGNRIHWEQYHLGRNRPRRQK